MHATLVNLGPPACRFQSISTFIYVTRPYSYGERVPLVGRRLLFTCPARICTRKQTRTLRRQRNNEWLTRTTQQEKDQLQTRSTHMCSIIKYNVQFNEIIPVLHTTPSQVHLFGPFSWRVQPNTQSLAFPLPNPKYNTTLDYSVTPFPHLVLSYLTIW